MVFSEFLKIQLIRQDPYGKNISGNLSLRIQKENILVLSENL